MDYLSWIKSTTVTTCNVGLPFLPTWHSGHGIQVAVSGDDNPAAAPCGTAAKAKMSADGAITWV